jgi:hypothetical protein
MKDLECPYCGKEQDVNHDDGFGYEENEAHEMECSFCDKTFVFQTSISYHYTPSKADCLNDGNHKYEPTVTAPREFTKMRCTMCGDERELTDNERTNLGIGTKDEFFEKIKNIKI